MSDVSIPGVTSKYDTQKLVEDLMKLERIPKVRAEENLKQVELQKKTWLDVNRRLVSLRESARALFSFQNPFNERVATSSDEKVLTASATREAVEETKTFTVKQIASADRFMSSQLPENYKVPSGNYVFTVGEATIKLAFGGGSLKDFSEAINRKGGDNLRAQVVPITKTERILLIEALKTGSQTRLGFSDAMEKFALDTGLIERASSSRQEFSVESPVPFAKALDAGKVLGKNGTLQVAPGAEAALKLPASVATANLVLELEIQVSELPMPPISGPPPGPAIPGTGKIEYEGIVIQGAPSEANLPQWTAPVGPPPRNDDPKILHLIDSAGRSIPLPAVPAASGYQKITIPLSLYADSFSGIGVRNNNTNKDVTVKSARIFDPTETSGFRPKNPVDTSRDAIIVLDGIQITRQSNKIDDLVPGVTLNLAEASDKPVKLKIEPNREAVKDSIIALVGNYNRVMAEINILSRKEDGIIQEISYFTDDERKQYQERLGLLQGDMTLSQVRSSLQGIMMNAYPTRSGTSVLSSFGISTNSQKGGGFDASRLRGYLEIDENAIMKALKENFDAVRDSFGFDTDKDLIIDSGAGFSLDALIKPYVETGGILTGKTRTLDTVITREKRKIEELTVQLASKEQELKRKYGQMEGAMGQLESSASAWDNFGKQQ